MNKLIIIIIVFVFWSTACENPTKCKDIIYFSEHRNYIVANDSAFLTFNDFLVRTDSIVNFFTIRQDSTMNEDSTYTKFFDTTFIRSSINVSVLDSAEEYSTKMTIERGQEYEFGNNKIGKKFNMIKIRLEDIKPQSDSANIIIWLGNFMQDCSGWKK